MFGQVHSTDDPTSVAVDDLEPLQLVLDHRADQFIHPVVGTYSHSSLSASFPAVAPPG